MHRALLILALLLPAPLWADGSPPPRPTPPPAPPPCVAPDRCPSAGEYLRRVETCDARTCGRYAKAGDRCRHATTKLRARADRLLCADVACRRATREEWRATRDFLRRVLDEERALCARACAE